MTDAITEKWAALVARINAWDGSEADAEDIRGALTELPPLSGKPSTDEIRVLARVYGLKTKKDGTLHFLALCAEPTAAKIAAPFIGDPSFGAWPFDEPSVISDEDAVKWLAVTGNYAAPGPRVRRFIRIFLKRIPRPSWQAAARAAVRLAARDDEMLGWLTDQWMALTAEKPVTATPSGLKSRGAGIQDTHKLRHFFYTACLMCASGKLPLPDNIRTDLLTGLTPITGNESDASAVLSGFGLLLAGRAPHMQVTQAVLRWLEVMPRSPMTDEAFLGMFLFLKQSGDSRAPELQIRIPAYLAVKPELTGDFVTGFNLYWSRIGCLEKLRNCEEEILLSDDERTILDAQENRIPGSEVLRLYKEALRIIFDEDTFVLTEPVRQVQAAVFILKTANSQYAAGLPWRNLLRVSGCSTGYPDAGEGEKLSECVMPAFTEVCTRRGIMPIVLLRDSALDEKSIITLAGCSRGDIENHAALQADIMIRKMRRHESAVSEIIRFLWKILQKNPSQTYYKRFRQLAGAEREATREPLYKIIDLTGRLDKMRDDRVQAENSTAEIYALLNELTAAVREMCEQFPTAETSFIIKRATAFSEEIKILSAPGGIPETEDGAEMWFLKISGHFHTATAKWAKWMRAIQISIPDEINKSFSVLEEAARAYFSRCGNEYQTLNEIVKHTREMQHALDLITLPESMLLMPHITLLQKYAENKIVLLAKNRPVLKKADHLFSEGDEKGLTALLADPSSLDALLSSRMYLEKAYKFLTDRMLFQSASRLKNEASHRGITLPSLQRMYRSPFLAGIIGFGLVLDYGRIWNETITASPKDAVLVAVLAALLPLTLLAAEFFIRTQSGSSGDTRRTKGWLRRVCGALVRVIPLYTLTFLGIGLIVAGVLWTLRKSPDVAVSGALRKLLQVVLWTGLSMTLGSVFGLMLEGRNLLRKSNSSDEQENK